MPFFRFIKSHRDGTFTVRFPDHVIVMIVELAGQLDAMLDDDRPELRRLFPTAYPGDAERDAGYQVFAHSELVDQRRANLTRLQASSSGGPISADDLMAWMHVVNDLRLVLGTVLDVSEDEPDIAEDDPRSDGFEIYHLLGAVLEEIVSALHSTLDD